MDGCKPVKTPIAGHFKLSNRCGPSTVEESQFMQKVPYANVVGSIMYLMVCSRPDIGYAVSMVSRFISNPGKVHWEAVKWLLRYLSGTRHYGLIFDGNTSDDKVLGYVDSDFAGDLDRGRSLTGYVFKVLGNTVSWKAQLQHIVALSSTEAEYIALTEAVKEAMWLKRFVKELGVKLEGAVVLCDNQGAVQLAKNSVHHERTKHISVKLHFIREVVSSGKVEVEEVDTQVNSADMLTKALPGPKFWWCVKSLKIG